MVYSQDAIILERCEKFLSSTYWTDVNLRSRIHRSTLAAVDMSCLRLSAEQAHASFAEMAPLWVDAAPCSVGDSFGPSWSTVWFRLVFALSAPLLRARIGLSWDSSSEAFLYSERGEYLQAFTGGGGNDRRDVCELSASETGASLVLFVEMACNGMFGNGGTGMIQPPDPNRVFTLVCAEIVEVDPCASALLHDMVALMGVAAHATDRSAAARALAAISLILNTVDLSDADSLRACSSRAHSAVFDTRGEPSHAEHEVHAFGHCHIDTAWLWPYKETRRKVMRSWATQLRLLQRHERWSFVASQAVHWEWLEEDHPALFARVLQHVRAGRFLPVGGSYVEFDANLPSCESLVRQFLYGMSYFVRRLQVRPEVFWLPDTFGYAAQLPQIMRGFGLKYFLSQKLSWNLFNVFPHTSFEWAGLDGSRVLAHFPPADTYCSTASAEDLVKCVANHKSLKSSNRSMLLFGHGDGGGGPASEHLESLARLQSCAGMPRVRLDSTPAQFFRGLESDHEASRAAGTVPLWRGELYLELHQGTLTSQATVKRQNRACEQAMRALEALQVLWVVVRGVGEGPRKEHRAAVEGLWKRVLLNQFHDVIPGSSIAQVYADADRMLSAVLKEAEARTLALVHSLAPQSAAPQEVALNMTTYARNVLQPDGSHLHMEPFSVCVKEGEPAAAARPGLFQATVRETAAGLIVLENAYLSVTLSRLGAVLALVDKRHERSLIGDGLAGNNLVLYDDVPFYWDAWDVFEYHRFRGRSLNASCLQEGNTAPAPPDATCCVTVHASSVVFAHRGWGCEGSSIEQRVSLGAEDVSVVFETTVDWHEAHKLLKVEFPLNIVSSSASYEMQGGFVCRPTHRNNSFDAAQFEVCGHRYADISEADYGVALLNDCKYGYSCLGSTLCLSLLRAPKAPDPACDMGRHSFAYALLPHSGGSVHAGGVHRAASNFNNKVRSRTVSPSVLPSSTESPESRAHILNTLRNGLCKVVGDDLCGLTIDAVKLSEDGKGVVLRFVEVCGTRGRARISTVLDTSRVFQCNLMEEPEDGADALEAGAGAGQFLLNYQPFKIVSVYAPLDGVWL